MTANSKDDITKISPMLFIKKNIGDMIYLGVNNLNYSSIFFNSFTDIFTLAVSPETLPSYL